MPAIDDALKSVSDRFPIADYMTPVKHTGAYATIANAALRYLQPGARILDSAAAPAT